MSLWEHPEAQALLNDATVSADTVRDCTDRLTGFLQRSLPKFYRTEQRENATTVIRGLLCGLERKTSEPIAIAAGLPRKPIQFFVGSGRWDDEAVMAELRLHVREELAEPDGVVVIDPSGCPKKGTESCGVDRPWCGRSGKVDNCQVGVFLAYAAKAGYAPLDRQLYLPEAWANDEARREKCHVPPEVKFREKWWIALDLLDRTLPGLPHGWIVGDDELGRAAEFRAALRRRAERYVLDVPCNTTVRDLERRRPPRKKAGVGRQREVPFRRADVWAACQPESRWERITVRDGEKGPLVVDAMSARVRAKEDGRIGPEERLVVIRPVGESRIDSALSDAGPEVPLAEVVRARRQRHRIEEVFEAGNGEAGLDHYEVRGWVGWHHPMTLSLAALWFLLKQAEQIDAEQDAALGSRRGDELPDELKRREGRLAKIREAKARLEAEARAKAEEEQRRRDEEQARREAEGRRRRGKGPAPIDPTPEDKAQTNFTDPEAKIMKQSNKGFDYSYNAQAVVDGADQIIVAAEVTGAANDKQQAVPMARAALDNLDAAGIERPKAADGTPAPIPNTADTGYFSKEAVEGLEELGMDPHLATGRQKHHEAPAVPPAAAPTSEASVKEKMQEKLRSATGKALDAARKQIVEPVFGMIKSARGIRKFLLRGLEKVSAEWQLICLTHNLLKIWRRSSGAARS